MRVGGLRWQVDVEQPVRTQDAAGSVVTSWSKVVTTWCGIEPLRGDERFKAQAVAAEVTHKLTLRHESALASMTPAWRVKLGNRWFDLLAVMDVGERDRVIECLATERVT